MTKISDPSNHGDGKYKTDNVFVYSRGYTGHYASLVSINNET
jgi:hypothetical protein